MKPPFNHSSLDPDERIDAWLASQPLTPAPDFVARTLVRIRTEAALMASAKAGDESAMDLLLDRWLVEQPLDSELEPAQVATNTRRAATREEQEESRTKKSGGHRIILFPAWARAATALAAAACVALIGYLSVSGPAQNAVLHVGQNLAANPVNDSSSDTFQPAHYAWNSDPNDVLNLSDSLKDLAPVANADDPDLITREFGDDAIN